MKVRLACHYQARCINCDGFAITPLAADTLRLNWMLIGPQSERKSNFLSIGLWPCLKRQCDFSYPNRTANETFDKGQPTIAQPAQEMKGKHEAPVLLEGRYCVHRVCGQDCQHVANAALNMTCQTAANWPPDREAS